MAKKQNNAFDAAMAAFAKQVADSAKAEAKAKEASAAAKEKERKEQEKISKMTAADQIIYKAEEKARLKNLDILEQETNLVEQLNVLAIAEEDRLDPRIKAAQRMLDLKNKEIKNQATIEAKFDKFKDTWDDFFHIVTDPAISKGIFLVAAADKAKEMGDSLMDAQKAMGLSYTQAIKMSGTLASAVGSGVMLGIGFQEAAEAAGALAETMGDLNEVTSGAIVTVARLGKKYGIAGSEAAGLYKQIKLMSGGTDEMADSQIQYTENLARANKVAPGKVVADMAKNSEFMAKFMGKNSKSMAETAVQAAKLGVSMSEISQMMDSILDIETSIEKEMQASVLLGRQISFDKARQLAMAGDALGATKAILEQVGGIAEFEKMSVIQRKALAEAAGVDLATMQSMIGNRQKQIEMGLVEASTGEAIGNFLVGQGKSLKDNMALYSATTNMLVNMGKIRLGERLQSVAHWIKAKANRALELAHAIKMKMFGGGGKRDAQGILRNAKGQFMKDPSKSKSILKSVSTPKPKPKLIPKEKPGKVSDMGMGKLGKNMKNIVMGAAAMVLVAAAVFVFAKAVQEFMSVSWEAVGMAVVSMLALVGAVALLGAIMMSGVGALAILAGAAAMIVVAGAMLVLAIALKTLSEAIPNFILFIPMLPELAVGLLTLVPAIPFMPFIGYGLMAMGAGFGVAAIGVGLFGAIGGVGIITGLATGMAILTPLAGGIAALGIAFGALGLGIMALGASLVLLTPMLPTLLALGGLALGVGAIMGGLGENEKGSDDGTNKIVEKLDTLIELMKEGGIVKMDGKQVGEVIALARGPMGM